ncbi:MAG: DUF1540 domain-containing protein [Clostridia bacterium]|nr:DUF1540 domain-containing protein [Clostridia bacterium]
MVSENNSGLFDTKNGVPKHIKGLECSVRNCSYNDSECFCTAKKIRVGPTSAVTGSDTICATFKPKEF